MPLALTLVKRSEFVLGQPPVVAVPDTSGVTFPNNGFVMLWYRNDNISSRTFVVLAPHPAFGEHVKFPFPQAGTDEVGADTIPALSKGFVPFMDPQRFNGPDGLVTVTFNVITQLNVAAIQMETLARGGHRVVS